MHNGIAYLINAYLYYIIDKCTPHKCIRITRTDAKKYINFLFIQGVKKNDKYKMQHLFNQTAFDYTHLKACWQESKLIVWREMVLKCYAIIKTLLNFNLYNNNSQGKWGVILNMNQITILRIGWESTKKILWLF